MSSCPHNGSAGFYVDRWRSRCSEINSNNHIDNSDPNLHLSPCTAYTKDSANHVTLLLSLISLGPLKVAGESPSCRGKSTGSLGALTPSPEFTGPQTLLHVVCGLADPGVPASSATSSCPTVRVAELAARWAPALYHWEVKLPKIPLGRKLSSTTNT